MNALHPDEDLERCTLSAPTDILFELRNLARQNERVTVSFDEGRRSFLTIVLDASEKELYFDIGGSDEINAAFLKSERAAFVGFAGGIRTQFLVTQARVVNFEGKPAFAAALPKSVLRVQRREAFRLQVPGAAPYRCRIRKSEETITLPLYDISVGGVGFMVPTRPKLLETERLQNCRIDLREGGLLSVTLEVRYVREVQSRLEKSLWHVGCEFIKLSPLNETLIQRFMARIEAERRAAARDS
jgi:c-di-GMP-binding flagellar brake protein YcgR